MLLRLHGCQVDLDRLEVRVDTQVAPLTPMESRLLRYLHDRRGEPADQHQLLEAVWDYNPQTLSRTVRTTVSRLRAKIEPDPSAPVNLVTIKGRGYALQAPIAPAPIGRSQDLERIASAHAAHPWVALVGPPGIGKSTLLRALARRLDPRRTVYVDLATTTDPREAADRIATAIGIEPGEPLEGATDDRTLLLDDLDGLATMGDQLEGWLTAGTRLVTTSRSPLGTNSEHVEPLGPLDPRASAVLFVERLGRRSDQVGPILEATAGIPLALEIAAAWAGTLGMADVAERCRTGHLLQLPEEHGRTLEGLFHTAWTGLDPAARTVLTQLGALATEPTPLEAEQLCGVEGFPTLLVPLKQAAWLRLRDGRLTILPPIRRFLARQERPEAQRDRLERWLLAMDPPQARWLGDFRGASCTSPDPATARALVDRVIDTLEAERSSAWWLDWLQTLLERDRSTPLLIRASLHASNAGHSELAVRLGREALAATADPELTVEAQLAIASNIECISTDEVRQLLEVALASAEELGLADRAARALTLLSRTHRFAGDHQQALVLVQRARAIRESLGDPIELGDALLTEGNLYLRMHDFDRVVTCMDRALGLLEAPRGRAEAESCRAHAWVKQGRMQEARQALERALTLFAAHGDRWNVAAVGVRLGEVCFLEGDTSGALDALTDASTMTARMGSERLRAGIGHAFAIVHLDRGDHEAALRHATDSLAVWRELAEPLHQGKLLLTTSRALHLAGRLEEALESYDQALEVFDALGVADSGSALVRVWRAVAELELGRAQAAWSTLDGIDRTLTYGDPETLAALELARDRFSKRAEPPWPCPEQRWLAERLERWRA